MATMMPRLIRAWDSHGGILPSLFSAIPFGPLFYSGVFFGDAKHTLLWRTWGPQIPGHERKFLLGVLGGLGPFSEMQGALGTPMHRKTFVFYHLPLVMALQDPGPQNQTH